MLTKDGGIVLNLLIWGVMSYIDNRLGWFQQAKRETSNGGREEWKREREGKGGEKGRKREGGGLLVEASRGLLRGCIAAWRGSAFGP